MAKGIKTVNLPDDPETAERVKVRIYPVPGRRITGFTEIPKSVWPEDAADLVASGAFSMTGPKEEED